DGVGNVTRSIDGRGNDTLYTYNQLNQVVQMQSEGPFRYATYTFYDANGNIVERSVENQAPVETDGKPTFTASGNFATTTATPMLFNDFYQYDILDHPIRQDVDASGSIPSRLVTTFSYD